MDVSDASYYINTKITKVKVAKWDTPKNKFKWLKKLKQLCMSISGSTRTGSFARRDSRSEGEAWHDQNQESQRPRKDQRIRKDQVNVFSLHISIKSQHF